MEGYSKKNLFPGQLVLVKDASDIFKRETYRPGRIHCVRPQQRKGKDIVRRATIAVLKDSGTGEIEYILPDLSKIAPYSLCSVNYFSVIANSVCYAWQTLCL